MSIGNIKQYLLVLYQLACKLFPTYSLHFRDALTATWSMLMIRVIIIVLNNGLKEGFSPVVSASDICNVRMAIQARVRISSAAVWRFSEQEAISLLSIRYLFENHSES